MRKEFCEAQFNADITFATRIYAMLHCSLAITSSKLVGTLSANSTKEPKIRNSKSSSESCFEEFIG